MFLIYVGLAALLTSTFIYTLVGTLTSPLRRLPSAPQPQIFKRLLLEPSPEQLSRWALDIPNNGLISYRGIFNTKRVLVTTTKGVQEIFNLRPYEFPKPSFVKTLLRGVIGEGLVVADGEQHKSQKKALQPAFKTSRIKNLRPLFELKALDLVNTIRSDISSQPKDLRGSVVDLSDYLRRATLDIIGMAGLGLDFDCLRNPENELATTYCHVFLPSRAMQLYRALTILIPRWILDHLPLKRNRELKDAVAVVRQYAGDVIERRQNSLNANKKHVVNAGNHIDTSDIIGSLMTTGHMTDTEELITQSMTFLGAGHETVHFATTAAVYELSIRPEVQDRLRSELSVYLSASSGTDQNPLGDLDNLQYLSAFCNEVYRLHPAVPHVRRQSGEATVICGHPIPKGTQLSISLRLFNHSPKLWTSDPHQFNPERWISDPVLGGALERQAFMTFGQGTRICIGERFARTEIKYLIATLVKSFEIELVRTEEDGGSTGFEVEHGGITSQVVGGLRVHMKPI
jgi:cytochrome P450